MNEPITAYARLGVTHHLLFPDCVDDPALHVETLPRVLNRGDIEVVDLCVPYGERRRSRALELIRASGKTVVYNGHLLPLMTHPMCSLSPTRRAQLLLLTRDQIDMAYAAGARCFVIGTGPEEDPTRRAEAYEGTAEYLLAACEYMASKGDMELIVELFDRDVAKKFLTGPSAETVEFVERLRGRAPNLALEVDIAHIPLMGESFEQVLRATAPLCRHVHLGNCVLKDRRHPFWGDMHPPIGVEGGEIDVPQLAEVFRLLLEVGYLNKETRGSMSIECRPFPDKTEEETIDDAMRRVRAAWALV